MSVRESRNERSEEHDINWTRNNFKMVSWWHLEFLNIYVWSSFSHQFLKSTTFLDFLMYFNLLQVCWIYRRPQFFYGVLLMNFKFLISRFLLRSLVRWKLEKKKMNAFLLLIKHAKINWKTLTNFHSTSQIHSRVKNRNLCCRFDGPVRHKSSLITGSSSNLYICESNQNVNLLNVGRHKMGDNLVFRREKSWLLNCLEISFPLIHLFLDYWKRQETMKRRNVWGEKKINENIIKKYFSFRFLLIEAFSTVERSLKI